MISPGGNFGRSPLPLSLPVDCEPGVDCWVFNYVDTDPGKDYADFACGRMSYDAHKGTDIAFAHTGRLNDRIAVRAAADGRVLGVRDGHAGYKRAPYRPRRRKGQGMRQRRAGRPWRRLAYPVLPYEAQEHFGQEG